MKNIRVYPEEIKLGLGDKIIASSKTNLFCPLQIDTGISEDIKKILASNYNQPDLFCLTDILVSVGWNSNDDVFIGQEVWKARNTSEDKPLNLEHNDADIIGHITENVVVSWDMQEIIADSTKQEDIPDSFHILNKSVLYVAREGKMKDIVEEIIAEIKTDDNQWGVSMELLCPDFNYALLDKSGNQHIVARKKETAYLSQYLKCYGGKGEHKGCKIGRAPVDFIFSGKGLTKNPANKNSVINPKTKVLAFKCISVEENYQFQEDVIMDELKKELEALKAAHKEEVEKLTKVQAEQKASIDTLISEKTQLVEASAVLATKLESTEKENKEFKEKFEAQEKAKLKAERVSKLQTVVGFDAEVAEKVFATLVGLDDTQFLAYLETTPKVVKKTEEETVDASKVLANANPEKTTPVTVSTESSVDKSKEVLAKFLAAARKTK